MVAAGADLNNCFFITNVIEDGKKPTLFDPSKDIDLLKQQIELIDNVSLLIIDPIVNIVNGRDNENSTVRRALLPVSELASKHNIAVIGITHLNKSTGFQKGNERIIGSTAFSAVARIIYMAIKVYENQNEKRVLICTKSNIHNEQNGFYYQIKSKQIDNDIEASFISWQEKVTKSADELFNSSYDNRTKNLIDTELINIITAAGGEINATQLTEQLQNLRYSNSQIEVCRNKLKNQGVIKLSKSKDKNGQWFWSLVQQTESKTIDSTNSSDSR